MAGLPGGTPGVGSVPTTTAGGNTVEIIVNDALQEHIAGATVNVDVGSAHLKGMTADTGVATIIGLPTGNATLSVSAIGFESRSDSHLVVTVGRQRWETQLEAPGGWAAGQAFILGTQQMSRAADGSALTFSVDLAVTSGENPQPLYGLTDENFTLAQFRLRLERSARLRVGYRRQCNSRRWPVSLDRERSTAGIRIATDVDGAAISSRATGRAQWQYYVGRRGTSSQAIRSSAQCQCSGGSRERAGNQWNHNADAAG